ncbi:MAG: prolipoprotein diacylglyceryl transferase [Candidatus Aminicenantes bacterium]|nr:prolipoprotein diacylglyceryl transferase [Candidatus Aminicenantes bacterium]
MFPVLIKIGPLTLHTYGFLLAVGVLAAILLILKLSKQQNIDQRVMADFMFYTILIGLLGAKIFLFVTEFKFYSQNPGEIKNLITSAGTFYGGLIFGALFAAWFLRKHKLNFRVLGDMVGPSLALAHFFGRMGCFFAGCCWGREAQGCSIAVEFTDKHTTTGVPLNVPMYPTQLMEAILNLLNFIILMILYQKKKFHGQVFALYIFNYSIIRFIVEFFRGDDDRGYIFGGMDHPFTSFSAPQLISVIGVITAIVLYKIFKKKGETPVEPEPQKRKKEAKQ